MGRFNVATWSTFISFSCIQNKGLHLEDARIRTGKDPERAGQLLERKKQINDRVEMRKNFREGYRINGTFGREANIDD